jgi:hypothetical protein
MPTVNKSFRDGSEPELTILSTQPNFKTIIAPTHNYGRANKNPIVWWGGK